ncbi:LysR family transcriptional regulator [Pseudonocardia sp.]|jgi:LysR family nitrogen assimilation transcriptional regulator|uniref:LysR family transcriptional regulator n=1 Tax=Pseudonocardia sp. TaxID=60912 RepID=UPI0026049EF9|nr:LysR family transcriptional regulator [Pseudonocardia sp.]MCW2720280.1 LysR family transcriptional regulator [Pseudonocardia sp.]MDT7618667.1 LysR family transcriptional regulator, nitrogen assimilation regulatory protein [Pseudonocardiales bacterium]
MNLKQLNAVVAVAETGSVTRAAELLHLVQPAVTRQILSLEQELGVTLFERSRAGMNPTDTGALLVRRARRALTELERARAEIRPEDPGAISGLVTVGLLESVATAVAEPLVSAVARRYPGIRLRLLTGYSGHLQEWLDAGTVEIALLYNVTTTTSLHVRPLLDESLWAVAPVGVWPDRELPVRVAELARQPMVMPAAPHGLRTLIDGAAARAGVSFDIAAEANAMSVQKQLVAAGVGWSVLPAIGVVDDIADGVLSGAPLSEPDVRRSIVLARSGSGDTPPAVAATAHELTRRLHDVVAHGGWPSARLTGRMKATSSTLDGRRVLPRPVVADPW